MLEEVPRYDPESKISKVQWEKELYKKVTQEKRDRIFFSYPTSDPSKGRQSSALSSNVFHVFKFIPYKKKNLHNNSMSSQTSSSSSTENFSDMSQMSINSFSTISSKTDSELEHIQASEESSSTSSREIEQRSEQEYKNIEKMEKRSKFPKQILYLDDSLLGQGKNMHVIQLASYRMSLLPYVSADSGKLELNR
jgi:hypothetical protein